MNNQLAEYVAKVMNDDRLSGYNIERRTHGEITQSYVLRIKNGTERRHGAKNTTVIIETHDEDEAVRYVLGGDCQTVRQSQHL